MIPAEALEQQTDFHHPVTVQEAVRLLAKLGTNAIVFAGGTWLMRAPAPSRHYVSLGRVAALRQLVITPETVRIGAAVTHDKLAAELQGLPGLEGLAVAAKRAANPAIRRRATVGGNLCTKEFPAADLVPALLAAEAMVKVVTPEGQANQSLLAYLDWRREAAAQNHLLVSVEVPQRAGRLLAHARLTLRRAGDYPVALISLSARPDAKNQLADVVVAVGAVEDQARRWPGLEQRLTGATADKAFAVKMAQELVADFRGREGPEVPDWYRLHVLPELLGRAMAQLQERLANGGRAA
ncbi:FAD binding domain-containing protein [Roseinatronobacter alkalisoli]|uniref:FAD binding domain-containing protein n=1 Tax=Roseinatronobacter alkalisoli TaxID=3028235 RepID=A0ABT5TGV4_9RHOB|nr:FAD binding domain-containing protein [Roseinatronobacter sp. HJB301]MDD7973591.1 FAD binding domain-containing protein [Roseinatronobacter sp. HJB301]